MNNDLRNFIIEHERLNGPNAPMTYKQLEAFIQSELTRSKREMIEYIENHNLSNPIDKMIIEILTRDLRQSFLTDNNKKDE